MIKPKFTQSDATRPLAFGGATVVQIKRKTPPKMPLEGF